MAYLEKKHLFSGMCCSKTYIMSSMNGVSTNVQVAAPLLPSQMLAFALTKPVSLFYRLEEMMSMIFKRNLNL